MHVYILVVPKRMLHFSGTKTDATILLLPMTVKCTFLSWLLQHGIDYPIRYLQWFHTPEIRGKVILTSPFFLVNCIEYCTYHQGYNQSYPAQLLAITELFWISLYIYIYTLYVCMYVCWFVCLLVCLFVCLFVMYVAYVMYVLLCMYVMFC